jgi:hypothetical protein
MALPGITAARLVLDEYEENRSISERALTLYLIQLAQACSDGAGNIHRLPTPEEHTLLRSKAETLTQWEYKVGLQREVVAFMEDT